MDCFLVGAVKVGVCWGAIHIQRVGIFFCVGMWILVLIWSSRFCLSLLLLSSISPMCIDCIFFVDGVYGYVCLSILQVVLNGMFWSFSFQMCLCDDAVSVVGVMFIIGCWMLIC